MKIAESIRNDQERVDYAAGQSHSVKEPPTKAEGTNTQETDNWWEQVLIDHPELAESDSDSDSEAKSSPSIDNDLPLTTINRYLKIALEEEFKPHGIVAFSTCCRWGCTGSYDEDDDYFFERNMGIYYIKLYLDGMNYEPSPKCCYVEYNDFDWLIENWVQERKILVRFCHILGLSETSNPPDFTIEKPIDYNDSIKIQFKSGQLLLDPRR